MSGFDLHTHSTHSDGTNTIIQAATRPPGGTFAAPIDLSATDQDASSPSIAAWLIAPPLWLAGVRA